MTFRFYQLFGAVAASPFRLEEAVECQPSGQMLQIVRSKLAPPADPLWIEGFRSHTPYADGDLLAYRSIGRFLVQSGGRRIEVDLEPGFDERLVSLPLLGPVSALALHRQGLLVLHGSAVEIGGRAHVFLGDKGSGKSTTAAALVSAGYRLIADDVVALEETAGGAVVIRPAFPAMKLDRAMMARFDPAQVSIIEPDDGRYMHGKCRVRLRGSPPNLPTEVARVHCLRRGPAPGVVDQPALAAMQALLRFAHHPRLGPSTGTAHEIKPLFELAAHFARLVALDVLTVRDGLEHISSIADLLVPAEAHHASA